MTQLAPRLVSYLEDQNAEYEVIHHRRDYTAQEAAADTHTPGRAFAKAVIIEADNQPVMAVVPAHHKVDLRRVARVLGASEAHLANETQMRQMFPDSEVGAEPPFGNLYGLAVYVSPTIAADEYITFNGGTHEDAVRMPYRVYQDLVHPKLADVSNGPGSQA